MPFEEMTMQRFAIQAHAMIEASDRRDVQIEKVAEAIGLTAAQGHQYAADMRAIGWATTSGDWLTLTPFAYRAIAKPKWLQWIDRHPLFMYLILTVIGGIIAGVVYSAINYYLLKMR